jgi:hypothetical protein
MDNWFVSSGAHAFAARSTLSYHDICERSRKPGAVLEADARQIALDVPRTSVSLFRFVLKRSVSEDEDLDTSLVTPYFNVLKRLLLAYAARNVRVGYVQGHADIMSYLLGYVHYDDGDNDDDDHENPSNDDQQRRRQRIPGYNEEQVFWVYVVLIERIFPSDFFARMPKLQGFHVDMEVFKMLISLKLPVLANAISLVGYIYE